MTKLSGSEKQIAWAEQIRDTFLNGTVCQGHIICKGIVQEMENLNISIKDYENRKPARTDEMQIKRNEMINIMKNNVILFNELKEKIENESSTKWFIDNRMNNYSLFVKEVFNK